MPDEKPAFVTTRWAALPIAAGAYQTTSASASQRDDERADRSRVAELAVRVGQRGARPRVLRLAVCLVALALGARRSRTAGGGGRSRRTEGQLGSATPVEARRRECHAVQRLALQTRRSTSSEGRVSWERGRRPGRSRRSAPARHSPLPRHVRSGADRPAQPRARGAAMPTPRARYIHRRPAKTGRGPRARPRSARGSRHGCAASSRRLSRAAVPGARGRVGFPHRDRARPRACDVPRERFDVPQVVSPQRRRRPCRMRVFSVPSGGDRRVARTRRVRWRGSHRRQSDKSRARQQVREREPGARPQASTSSRRHALQELQHGLLTRGPRYRGRGGAAQQAQHASAGGSWLGLLTRQASESADRRGRQTRIPGARKCWVSTGPPP